MAQLINEAKRMQLLAGLITESQLNEDDTHINKIARDLYSFLKKYGVNVALSKERPSKPTKTIGDMSKQPGMSKPGVTADNTATIFVYKGNKGGLEISVRLNGDKRKVEEVESKLLAAYPGLEQSDRQGSDTHGMTGKSLGFYSLAFRVKEKTTKKGGYVSNTQQNAKPAAQPQQESIEQTVNEALKKFRKGK